MRIIYPGCHYKEALSIAQCLLLEDRRQTIQEPSSYLQYLLPPTREDIHGRRLRNNMNYSIPKLGVGQTVTKIV
jgi:hypothetical protein